MTLLDDSTPETATRELTVLGACSDWDRAGDDRHGAGL